MAAFDAMWNIMIGNPSSHHPAFALRLLMRTAEPAPIQQQARIAGDHEYPEDDGCFLIARRLAPLVTCSGVTCGITSTEVGLTPHIEGADGSP